MCSTYIISRQVAIFISSVRNKKKILIFFLKEKRNINKKLTLCYVKMISQESLDFIYSFPI